MREWLLQATHIPITPPTVLAEHRGHSFCIEIMKYPLIEVIGQTEISFFLAVQSMLPWEGVNPDGYLDGSLQVKIHDKTFGRQIRALTFNGGEPVLYANEIGNRIEWVRGADDWPGGLTSMIRALGGQDGKNAQQGKVLLSLDSDTVDARLSAVDQILNLLRFLSNAGVPDTDAPVAVACILHWATQWQTLRCKILEMGESIARNTQMSEWVQQMQSNRFGLSAYLAHVEPHYDPRGTCFELIHRKGRSTYVSSVKSNWEPGPANLSVPTKRNQRINPRCAVDDEMSKLVPVTRIDSDVLTTLRAARVQGNELFLGDALPKKLYDKVNTLLVSLGGRWHTGKRSHVFEQDPTNWLVELLDAGWIRTAKDYEFFPTPRQLVDRMLQGIPVVPGMLALEPHAGDAAIAEVLAQRVGGRQHVRCYELWARNVATLRAKGFDVHATDFLSVEPQPVFDIVALNPPFSGGRDVRHVAHALKFVKPGGWLTAITSTSWQGKDSAANLRFRSLLMQHGAVVDEIDAGTFAESGTKVPTLLLKMQVKAPAKAPIEIAPTSAAASFDLLAYM